MTGSRDCTCIIWSIQNHTVETQRKINPVHSFKFQLHQPTQANNLNNFTPTPLKVLYGHDDEISSVAIYTELDIVVSGSLVISLFRKI